MLAMTLSPTADLAADSRCPECAQPLVQMSGAAPWCPACEWGLGDPGSKPPAAFGWRWLDRRVFRLAYRVTRDEFRRLDGAPELPSGRMRWSSLMVTAAALVIYAGVAACLVAGVWLCTVQFPSPMLLPGVLLILVAVELRPRFGRLPRHVTVLDPGAAPELHRLVARVAEAVGAPMPQVVCLAEDSFNASAGTVGLRRRRVLTIGVPLWQALGPQQRVALLGHELGHFVNRDPGRGLLVQPVYLTLATVVDLLRPVRNRISGLIEMIGQILLFAVMAVIRWPLTGVWLGLAALGQRGGSWRSTGRTCCRHARRAVRPRSNSWTCSCSATPCSC
jgi:heat shock protein HtpX